MSNIKQNNSENKNIWQRIKGNFTNRTAATGLYVAILSVVFIAVVVFINLIVTKADITGDLSANKVYSLTKDTEKYLKKLENDIVIYYVSDPQEINDNVYELVKKYEEKSKSVKVILKDPVVYPTFLDQYTDEEETASNSVVVVNKNDETKFKYIAYSSLVKTEVNYQTYTQEMTGVDVEGQITSAINYVTAEASMKMYFLTGHDESENFDSSITDLISKQNIETAVLNLQTKDKVPSDCELLAIVSPKRDFTEEEIEKINKYFEKGKPIIMCLGYVDRSLPNISKFLKGYGLENHGGLVVEKSADNRMGQGYTMLYPDLQGHDITGGLEGVYACFPIATGIKEADVVPKGLTVEPILKTSSRSYAVTDLQLSIEKITKKNSEVGPFYAGALVTSTKIGGNAKMIVFNSSAAFDGTEQLATSSYINSELLMNSINYICDVDASTTVTVPVKELSTTYLSIDGSQQLLWTLFLVIIIPVFILIVGFVVWIRRRRR